MHGKIYDMDGSYITVPQVKFFLNREGGRKQFMLVGEEFIGYLKICKVYNLVSDLLEQYPKDGFFYWDEDKECVSFAFIEGSTISNLLDHFGVSELDFGNGQDQTQREDF
tara:strand:- start:31 stop:360 length:330 start_codon:yes stop_codon:yes gene_type:complete